MRLRLSVVSLALWLVLLTTLGISAAPSEAQPMHRETKRMLPPSGAGGPAPPAPHVATQSQEGRRMLPPAPDEGASAIAPTSQQPLPAMALPVPQSVADGGVNSQDADARVLSLGTAAIQPSDAISDGFAEAPAPVGWGDGASAVAASEGVPAEPRAPRLGRVDVGLSSARLSGGQPNWFDVFARGHVVVRPGSVAHWGLSRERHYDEHGTVASVALVQDLNERWYASAGLSGGTASFHSRWRADAGLFHKWGFERRLVTGASLMRSHSRDGIHRDTGLTLTQMVYSPNAWVVQAGTVINRSNPGAVTSARGFAALTMGTDKQRYVVARVDHGREAYLPEAALSDPIQRNVAFTSTEFSLELRQWLSDAYGFTLGATHYRNPHYRRTGLSAAVFVDF